MSENFFNPDASQVDPDTSRVEYLAQIEQLETAFAQQSEQFQTQSVQLQHAIEALGMAASMRSPASTMTEVESQGIKLKLEKPEDYLGDRKRLRPFLANLRLKFFAEPHLFRTEQAKIAYAGSLLRGDAFAWFEPHLVNITEYMAEIATFEAFATSLKVAFGDPDEAATAEREIRKLFQGNRPITAYTADFMRISSQLNWDDEALKSVYRFGLSERVKDELARIDEPATRSQLTAIATRIDGRLHARDLERRDTQRGSDSHGIRPTPRPLGQTTQVKMTQEALAAPRALQGEAARAPLKTEPTRGPLDASEKQRRYDNNLCLYCGQGGHKLSECKIRGGKSLSAVAVGNMEAVQFEEDSGN